MSNSKSAKSKNSSFQNRNASIRTRSDQSGNVVTDTVGRDDGTINVSILTNSKTDSTTLVVDTTVGASYKFDGRTARTLYRALQKHYQTTNKAW